MSFYTPTWIRKLVKEDHDFINKYVAKVNNDFRSYIDETLPFTLYLDIDLIRERILYKPETTAWIQELAELAGVEANDILGALDKTYVGTINRYAENPKYKRITAEDLSVILNRLSEAVQNGFNIKSTLATEFKNTFIVTNITKLNTRVMLILPKFKTLNFGATFKEVFKTQLPRFSDEISDRDSSPRVIIENFLNANFGRLQNVGHVEVDIISSTSREVKRGQNSPRLLQALVSLPKGVQPERIARQFSTETGQQETRVIVRKKFSSSKLVFEMLVESGMSVGIPETQKVNLQKAALEKKFQIGAGLTKQIITNTKLLIELETSKSIKQFLAESVINTMKKGVGSNYTSSTTIVVKTPIKVQKVAVNIKKPTTRSVNKPTFAKAIKTESLSSLQSLLDVALAEQIQKNMGSGSSRNLLNYRTGRLAESAKVERLSESRQGMITAFYSYMKNPYATFSEGGRQSVPRTRDPKLLIAKSIREIGATLAYNRMRAVLI